MSSGQLATEISDEAASWPWLAEVIRATCCQLYALGGNDDSDRHPRHSNEILSEVRRRLGDLDGFSPEKDTFRAIFRLLLRLGDFAHVRRGTYLPRETRILLFSPAYARIAGGLPFLYSEFRDEGVLLCESETIGRITTVSNETESFPPEWSFSRSFTWGRMSVEERLEMLISKVRKQTPAITENVTFYNPKKPRSNIRSSRWQNPPPLLKHSIARRAGVAFDYFLVTDCGSSSERWFEISSEDSKCWLVIVDQMAGTVHSMRRKIEDGRIRFSLPINMPDFCIEALASASVESHHEEALLHFCIPASLAGLVDYICSIAALDQYE